MLIALGFGAAHCLLGMALLVIGFLVVDWLTPGSLGRHIYENRSLNAALVVSACFLSLGAVMFTAIWSNGGIGVPAFVWSAAFGLLGVVLQAAAFLLLDALTPGSLRDLAVAPDFHPGALVAAAAMIAVGMVVCASIA